MKYSDAINKLFNDFGVDIFSTPYHAFCILNDYIGNDLESKSLVNVLYIVEKQIDIVSIFKDNSLLDARKIMEKHYLDFKSSCNAKEYVAMINPISKYLRPDEFVTSSNINRASENVAVMVKTHKKVSRAPLIISKPQVKKATPNKPVKTKKRKANIKAATLDVNCESLNLFTSDLISDPEVYIDGVLSKNKANAFVISGVGMFYLNYPGQDVVIRMPNVSYDTITLNGKCNKALINYKKANALNSKRLTIKLNCENLKVNGFGEYLNMDVRNCNVDLYGQYWNVDGVGGKGSLNFDLDLKGLNGFFMNWKQGQGDIHGNFVNALSGIQEKQRTHWFTSLNVNKHINKTHCILNLKTKSGKIKIN